MESVFSEEGEYYTYSSVDRLENGKFEASVSFERQADWAANREMIPSVRHRILREFDSDRDAMQAALAFAREKAAKDDVGL